MAVVQINIMKTKPLTFLLALTFLFLFSGSVFGDDLQDAFSAFMVSKVLKSLTDEQKSHLLSKPIREIIAISYKLAARTEF